MIKIKDLQGLKGIKAEEVKAIIDAVCRKFNKFGDEDCEQVALIAVWKATERFNGERGTINNYVYSSCLYEVRRYCQTDKLVAVPINRQSAKMMGGKDNVVNTYVEEWDDNLDTEVGSDPEREVNLNIALASLKSDLERSVVECFLDLKALPAGTRKSINAIAKLHGISADRTKKICEQMLAML